MSWYYIFKFSQVYLPYGYWLSPEGQLTTVPEQSHFEVANGLGYSGYDIFMYGWVRIVNPGFNGGRFALSIQVSPYGITSAQMSSLQQLVSKVSRMARRDGSWMEYALSVDSNNSEYLLTEKAYEAISWLQQHVGQLMNLRLVGNETGDVSVDSNQFAESNNTTAGARKNIKKVHSSLLRKYIKSWL